jgi:hypothetical protein
MPNTDYANMTADEILEAIMEEADATPDDAYYTIDVEAVEVNDDASTGHPEVNQEAIDNNEYSLVE